MHGCDPTKLFTKRGCEMCLAMDLVYQPLLYTIASVEVVMEHLQK